MRYRVIRVTHDKEVMYVEANSAETAIRYAKSCNDLDWDLVLDEATVKSPTYEVEDD